MKIQPVVLSGGSGTRLWPLSREHYPKQLLALTSARHTMLQETVMRVSNNEQGIEFDSPVVVCNEQHRFLIAEQLRQLKVSDFRIILEPVGRNTAPALTLVALIARQQACDDPMLVMPADHVIENPNKFHEAVKLGYEIAERGGLVTFGIVPDKPETGYGYIRMGGELDQGGCYTIAQFVEKPDSQTAQSYLDAGNYVWNSGMFLMKPSVWLQQIQQQQPEMLACCEQAVQQGQKDLDFIRVGEQAFRACPSDSIDYAVMENLATQSGSDIKTDEAFGAVISLDAGWSDVGSWSALWEVGKRDQQGNVVNGDVQLHNTNDSYIHAEHRFVASVGLEDTIIVETADAVLVAKKDQAQDVKRIVEWLKAQEREERLVHREVFRPWGSYEGVVSGERFQVKRIVVNPGASLSLQMHHHRAEHWIVVKGTAKVTRGDEQYLISENESTYIPLGVTHRLENPGKFPLEIIEVQSGSYLGEDDIVRFDDHYGRDS